MLNFKNPTLEDKLWVRKCLEKSQFYGCEYSFGNVFIWSPVYNTKIAEVDGFFCSKSLGRRISYSFPAGEGNLKAVIEKLIEDSIECNHEFRLFGITENGRKILDELFPNRFEYKPYRDGFDYIYSTEDLINLKGKKYHGKRNHISYFKNNNEWSFEIINRDNISECYKMNEEWEAKKLVGENKGLEKELGAVKRALDNYEALDFVGGILRVQDKVVAYTLGEKLNDDVFCTHIEKAFADVRGAYPAINREFAVNVLTEYKYINREEDTGDEGLRKAKLSYYPEILLEKSEAVLINDE